MTIDIRSHKKKVLDQKPQFNLVPFIDILFTILIFLVLTSNFGEVTTDITDVDDSSATGKPNVTDTSGTAEYYLVPVHNLQTVIVNGQDMSSLIRGGAIGVHTKVIDEGEVATSPGKIVITTPPGMSPETAVKAPN
ncbi:ExbD/TolR family protein [Methanobrevibacter sp. DSM 116169]|uniref:ExbD/TolR family protein n=1 Tax=Methanobrevibacter sp. DSM 116169 TaxID=3242727 RepID=UPI0038FCD782